MPTRFPIRPARPTDLPAILALLEGASLPREGVAEHLEGFFVAESQGSEPPIVACGGLERYGKSALLRSVAILPEARGEGLGSRVVEALVAFARREGTDSVVLLTTTAAAFFPRFGFRVIARADVPDAVHRSREFQGACPASATAMRLDLVPDDSE